MNLNNVLITKNAMALYVLSIIWKLCWLITKLV